MSGQTEVHFHKNGVDAPKEYHVLIEGDGREWWPLTHIVSDVMVVIVDPPTPRLWADHAETQFKLIGMYPGCKVEFHGFEV